MAGVKWRVRPKIVCLCGSSTFIEQMAIKAWEIEKGGAVALGLHLLPRAYNPAAHHQAELEGVAEHMDELHLRKIDLADEVYVVNVDGYVGDSTRNEIAYAILHRVPIVWHEGDGEAWMIENSHDLGQRIAKHAQKGWGG